MKALRYNVNDFFLFNSIQCSVTCGNGFRRRTVRCTGDVSKCDYRSRPKSVERCNPGLCPTWIAGEWDKVDSILPVTDSKLVLPLVQTKHKAALLTHYNPCPLFSVFQNLWKWNKNSSSKLQGLTVRHQNQTSHHSRV